MRLELVAILLCSIRIRTMNTKFHEAQKSNYEHLELLLREAISSRSGIMPVSGPCMDS